MAPSAIPIDASLLSSLSPYEEPQSSIFHQGNTPKPILLTGSDGISLFCEDGRKILDASGGPGVVCLGYSSKVKKRVSEAKTRQLLEVPYAAAFFTTTGPEDLERFLLDSTRGEMAKAWFCSSGSEGIEAAAKVARKYHVEKGQPQRVNFIARKASYHGATNLALSLGCHEGRREIHKPVLNQKVFHVSRCNQYRDLLPGETTEQYVERLIKEAEDEIKRLGPETVCAFVAEPMVGAAMGCVPPVKGYFQAMRALCDRYGILLIFDEVMCGMGRSGYLHAWQHPLIGVVPDIQVFGKGLGSGYSCIAGIMMHKKVTKVLNNDLAHGQTYQNHAIACAGAYEVQRIIQEWNLLDNVCTMGKRLCSGLERAIGNHPNVGNIRGWPAFMGIEFVMNKKTKEPFPHTLKVAEGIHQLGLKQPHCICLYHGQGSAGGLQGDHIMIMPAYLVTAKEIDLIVERTAAVITQFFETANL